MDLTYYVPNGEFDLLATPADRIESIFNDEPYIEVFFRMHLKRKTLYYGLNWIVPSILISVTNILGFTMPSECGEKITLRESSRDEIIVNVYLSKKSLPIQKKMECKN
ncbi:unnamed protein product [Cylicostephanus goldi]|uniref:Neurotransmitter-gated ion-channel ligand-binding domain-containing protein n=1 Tax=Cylicostephanus goldi TaxID=71465 RepID=A0A3P7Q4D0_CYLGO|nr:unnamed protein product [Cylicostephanus goldi]